MKSVGKFSKGEAGKGGTFEQAMKMFWRTNRIKKPLGDQDWKLGRSASDSVPYPSGGLDHGVSPADRYP